jgi:hypothetical protein
MFSQMKLIENGELRVLGILQIKINIQFQFYESHDLHSEIFLPLIEIKIEKYTIIYDHL